MAELSPTGHGRQGGGQRHGGMELPRDYVRVLTGESRERRSDDLLTGATELIFDTTFVVQDDGTLGVDLASIKLDDLASPDDNTDLNASTSTHGLLPKLSNVAAEFLNGKGNWTTPIGSSTEVTVSSGSSAGDITITGSFHSVDTESDAATDDLYFISDGSVGQLLLLEQENSSRDVTLNSDAAGAPSGFSLMKLTNLADFILDASDKRILLLYDGTEWKEVWRHSGSSSAIASGQGAALTIASGAVTVETEKSYYVVDTESGAATDDLDTINGGAEGQIVVFASLNGARTVVFKHGTGNVSLAGSDFSADNPDDTITLMKKSDTKWFELSRSNNG